jgi:hypothetical protein
MENASGAGLLKKNGSRKKCENEGVMPSFSHFYIAFSEKAISKLISLSLFRYFFQASS